MYVYVGMYMYLGGDATRVANSSSSRSSSSGMTGTSGEMQDGNEPIEQLPLLQITCNYDVIGGGGGGGGG